MSLIMISIQEEDVEVSDDARELLTKIGMVYILTTYDDKRYAMLLYASNGVQTLVGWMNRNHCVMPFI
jgi:DNA helicase TIP49 (TBP-interacting protein)